MNNYLTLADGGVDYPSRTNEGFLRCTRLQCQGQLIVRGQGRISIGLEDNNFRHNTAVSQAPVRMACCPVVNIRRSLTVTDKVRSSAEKIDNIYCEFETIL